MQEKFFHSPVVTQYHSPPIVPPSVHPVASQGVRGDRAGRTLELGPRIFSIKMTAHRIRKRERPTMRQLRFLIPRRASAWAVVAILLGIVGYSIATRTLDDYVTYVTGLTAFWQLFLSYLSMRLAHLERREIRAPDFKMFVYFLIRAVPFAVITYAIGVCLKDLYIWLAATQYTVIVVGATLVIGFYLFAFRRDLRFLYGVSEVLVGLLVSAYRYAPQTSLWQFDVFLPFLTAGVYLVVRGFDNIHQGLNSDPIDPFVGWLTTYRKSISTSQLFVPRRLTKGQRPTTKDTMKSRRKAPHGVPKAPR